jgi:hypothetical protein
VGHEGLVEALADEETDGMLLVLHDLHLDLIVETHLVVMHMRVHEGAHILAESRLLPLSALVALLTLFLVDIERLLLRDIVQVSVLGREVLANFRCHPQILHHLR